jgi:hypothetical protein
MALNMIANLVAAVAPGFSKTARSRHRAVATD